MSYKWPACKFVGAMYSCSHVNHGGIEGLETRLASSLWLSCSSLQPEEVQTLVMSYTSTRDPDCQVNC